MASSKKLRSSDLLAFVEAKLKNWVQPGQHLTLALSGGVDSVVLLDVLAQLRSDLFFTLSAVHINHQISPNAADWADFCSLLCMEHGVSLQVVGVDLKRKPGESLEALARDARYRVFANQKTDFVVMAHHLDDQAETVMLQLLRGSGSKGLSAMAEKSIGERSGKCLNTLRPLLDVPRRVISDYASMRALKWVEDESNLNVAYDRNYLRHQIMPVLEQRFPCYRETFARSSRHLAESAELSDDLARIDGADAEGIWGLRVNVLLQLSEARSKNLLRHWLAKMGEFIPSSAQLENLLQQVCSARDDAKILIVLGNKEIRRYQGEVVVVEKCSSTLSEIRWVWHRQDQMALPELGGKLIFEAAIGRGVSLARLNAAPVTIRLRKGAERLQTNCVRPNRSLKNLFQEMKIPPWQRNKIPLLFSGERLVFVPGIGIDCDYQANPNESGVIVKFETSRTGDVM